MDINVERALIIRELQQVEDPSLLRAIKAVLYYGLHTEGKITLEQYNQELKEAEERIAQGNVVKHEDAVTRIKQWRKNET